MTSTTAGQEAPAGRLDPALRRLSLVVILGAVMTILDTTIVNVAVNTLGVRFHTSLSTIQWVVTAYTLALSMSIPITGWAVRRFGAKTMWLTSLVLFVVGSALCGAAWSTASLIVFRVVQGFGGGMVMPIGQQMLARAAGPDRMGRMMAIVTVPAMLGPVLGPVLGGLIIDNLDWRWMFYVNAPVCVVAIALAVRLLPHDTERQADARLDVLGLALLSPGLAAFVYGLSEAGNGHPVSSVDVLAGVCAGVVLVAAFVVHALRLRDKALVDVRVFARRWFGTANATLACYCAGVFGVMILLPLYSQLVRHEDSLQAGLLLAPLGLGAMVTMPVAGKLSDRIGPRWVAMVGVVLALAGAVTFTRLDASTPVALLAAAVFVIGLGHGAAVVSLTAAGYRGASPGEVPARTTANNIVVRAASSIGTAVLAVALQVGIRHQLPGAGGSLAEAGRSRVAHASDLLATAFGGAFWWAIGLVGAAAVLTLLMPVPRSGSRAAVPARADGARAEPTASR